MNPGAGLRVQVDFRMALLFIFGLIVSFVLFDKRVVYLFSGYLSAHYDGNLRKIAILGNLREGLSSFFVLAIHISQSHVGRFYIIVFCTGASVIGMVLQWTSVSNVLHWISSDGRLYASLTLIALGYAQKSTLRAFFEYQLKPSVNPSTDKTTIFNISAHLWWYSAWILGYLLVLLWLSPKTWAGVFQCAALIAGIACIWFCCGYSRYRFEERSKSRSCLDKAAIIEDPSSDANSKEKQEINGPEQQVREAIFFASMILILLPYSLVSGAESTFFLLQNDNLGDALVLSLVLSLTRECVAKSRWLDLASTGITIVRIGLGMFCAVLCCFLAWWVETQRIKEDPNEELPIKNLLPQYLLLGLAAGLAEDGCEVLFCNHVPKTMCDTVFEPFKEFVFCLRSILAMLLIFSITPWFKDSLKTSQLQAYYGMLAILNTGALLLYVFFPWKYICRGGRTEGGNQTNTEGVNQDGQEGLGTAPESLIIQVDSNQTNSEGVNQDGQEELGTAPESLIIQADSNQTNSERVNQDGQEELGTAPESNIIQVDSDHATAGTSATEPASVRGAATVLGRTNTREHRNINKGCITGATIDQGDATDYWDWADL